jgi:deoxyhypusine synthase
MIDFTKTKTCASQRVTFKVSRSDFARAPKVKANFRDFYKSLPDILKGRDLRSIVEAVTKARKRNKPVIFMCGAHVIKCGLSPVVIELIKRGIITCLSFNGAGIIHDFEIASQGETSEDVASSLRRGRFGMNRRTAQFLNQAILEGVGKGLGIGQAVGEAMIGHRLPFRNLSIIYQAIKLKVPVTVHIAVGTDIIHQHPNFNAGLTAEGSLRDFRTLVEIVSRLNQGGVLLNFGSAVILPEVFLKALNLARNLSFTVKNFTTANFDMIYHYRPAENIVRRPVLTGGKGYYIVGHHEIMLPLLAQAIIERYRK